MRDTDPVKVALGIVFGLDRRNLLLQEKLESGEGLLYLPGGKLEPREKPMIALRRELYEKLDLIDYRKITHLFDMPWTRDDGKNFMFYVFAYIAANFDEIRNRLPDKHRLATIPADEVERARIHPLDHAIITEAMPDIAKEIAGMQLPAR